jgi:hypothetical protein
LRSITLSPIKAPTRRSGPNTTIFIFVLPLMLV